MPVEPKKTSFSTELIKKYLLTGLLVWIPLVITLWVLVLVVDLMDQTLMLLPDALHPRVMLGIHNLVQGHISRGELVYAHPAQLRSGRSNFMRINPVARRRPPVAHFASHLLCALQVH